MAATLACEGGRVIDRDLKRSLGQMVKGVQVVGAAHDGLVRAYTSHWICQVSFEEPIVMASVSPKHDTHPLIVASGRFSVSILAGDQVEAGQYFSYPGHRMRYVGEEHLRTEHGLPVVEGAVAWLVCEVERSDVGTYDHDLFFARVTAAGRGRLDQPPLLYSSRHGWRVTGAKAREPGTSIRDRLLARVEGDAPGDDPSGDGA
jgi:3-hydroxy-9,10-secoandrosta-1,3,5(10)-triene-9,17-dione monooxygenase reductase component